jgi:energy-converting hydrogenase Eha subunit E
VPNRASTWNLLLSIGAFLLFMVVLLGALGGGVGEVELLIWLVIVAIGVSLIVMRYRQARTGARSPTER